MAKFLEQESKDKIEIVFKAKTSQSGYIPAGGVHSQREKTSLLEIDGILLEIQKFL